jgi:elongation factor Ts
VEVNSETDFVAKNEKFQALVLNTARAAISVSNSENYVENVREQLVDGRKIRDEFTNNIAVIGENLQLRRGRTIKLEKDGLIVSYLHNRISDNCGTLGVLLALESSGTPEVLGELGKQLAMHIAASKPEFLDRKVVPEERLARERDVFVEQTKNSNRPQNIIEKMIEGRIRKFYEETCLLDQVFVMDSNLKIADVLSNFSKNSGGATVKIQDFVFFVLGEGLEKKENNFVEDINSILK